MLEIVQIPVLHDNYVYLLHDAETVSTAVVDPAVPGPVIDALTARGWTLDYILNTHHHGDHTGANNALKTEYGATIFGPRAEADKIPGIDRTVGENDIVMMGNERALVFDVPGHTAGHIAYYFRGASALFCGDTLFSLGCGRLFEGTPAQMWASLAKLKALPGETRIYCAHEYTEANGRFALTVEPGNPALQARITEVAALRRENRPTVPSTIAMEEETNPFLRPDSREIQEHFALKNHEATAVFAALRQAKDNF